MHRKNTNPELLVCVMKTIDEIQECLFYNLFPGANYQRLITSLELLEVMQNAFFNYKPSTGMNKGSGALCDPSTLVQHVQGGHGLMHFYSLTHLARLLVGCVLLPFCLML